MSPRRVSPRRKKTEISKGQGVLIVALLLIGGLVGGVHDLPTIILLVVAFVVLCVGLAGAVGKYHEQKQKEERLRQESEERSRQMEEDRRKRREQLEEQRRREERERQEQIEALLQRDAFSETVDDMSGTDFENFMANVFDQKGYAVQTTPASGDQGVDLLVTIDDRKVAVQLKRYTAPVGNAAVQAAFAGMFHYKAKEAWVITTSSFTPGAKQLAKSTGVRLIDRRELEEWLSDLREET